MKYRMGRPLWKLFAKLGATIEIQIIVEQDQETGRFIATSPDLKGLFCEDGTIKELKESVAVSATVLLECEFKNNEKHLPTTNMDFSLA